MSRPLIQGSTSRLPYRLQYLISNLLGKQADYLVVRMPADVQSIAWSIPERVNCSFIGSTLAQSVVQL